MTGLAPDTGGLPEVDLSTKRIDQVTIVRSTRGKPILSIGYGPDGVFLKGHPPEDGESDEARSERAHVWAAVTLGLRHGFSGDRPPEAEFQRMIEELAVKFEARFREG